MPFDSFPREVAPEELTPVCAYVAERTGSLLSRQQLLRLRAAVDQRLGSRSEHEYVEFLKSMSGVPELLELMSAIAVHKTDLFRDEVQLEAFRRFVLPPLVARGRPLRVWSAGCASGEEVATLLIMLAEAGAAPASTVLGTDLSHSVLEEASRLSFRPAVLERVAPALRAKYFEEQDGRFVLTDALRAQARFEQHNLMDHPYPFPRGAAGFDLVFCRNVLIYFSETAFDAVVAGLAERLVEGGTLVVSAAEPILRRQALLHTVSHNQSFFYVRKSEEELRNALVPSPSPPVAAPRRPRPSSPRPSSPRPSERGEDLAAKAPLPTRSTETPPDEQPSSDVREEAVKLFHQVVDTAATGSPEEETERGLRRCLYLDPHFSQARYMLGVLLERKGERADAASEFRRAQRALAEGRSRPVPFFLNDERLEKACRMALDRLGYGR